MLVTRLQLNMRGAKLEELSIEATWILSEPVWTACLHIFHTTIKYNTAIV
jgi:hypothetical protein